MSDKRPCTPCRIPVPTKLTLAHSRQHPQEANDTRKQAELAALQYQADKAKEPTSKLPYPSKGKIKLTTSKATCAFGETPTRKSAIPCPVSPVGRPRTAVCPPSEEKLPSAKPVIINGHTGMKKRIVINEAVNNLSSGEKEDYIDICLRLCRRTLDKHAKRLRNHPKNLLALKEKRASIRPHIRFGDSRGKILYSIKEDIVGEYSELVKEKRNGSIGIW